jgi:hypothetical protein
MFSRNEDITWPEDSFAPGNSFYERLIKRAGEREVPQKEMMNAER